MLRRILLTSVIAGTLAGVGMTSVGWAAEPGAAPAGFKCPLADTPLGRMVSGCVGRLLVLRSEMNVTPEQKAKIRDVLVSHKPQIAQTVKSVRDKRVVLRDAVLSGKADEAQIRAAADDLGKAIADAAVKASKLRNEIAPILTEEQRHLIGKFLKDNDEAVNKFLEKAAEGK
jgi:Spy/CpxP family protein refolding chaperone